MFKKLFKYIGYGLLGIACALVIGYILNGIFPYAWFWLSVAVVGITALTVMKEMGKGYATLSTLILTAVLIVILLPILNNRYPVLSHALGNREVQSELDAAKEINEPFAETRKAFSEYDNGMDQFTGNSVREKLKNHDVQGSYNLYRQETTRFKDRQDTLKKIEDETLNRDKVKNVSYSSSENSRNVRSYQEVEVEFPADGEVRVPIDMKIGDRVEYCVPTTDFKVKGKYQWHTISDYADHRCTSENPAIIKGAGKRGKVLVRVTPGYYL